MKTKAYHRTIFFSNTKSNHHILPDQLIIRVWKWCNFRCVFCNVAENESLLNMKSSIKEILAITFYKIKYSSFKSWTIHITISGWEPSIFQKETIFIIKFFYKYFAERNIAATFDLQSNASNIDKRFAEMLKTVWVKQALISSHTSDEVIFEKMIWVNYKDMGPRFERGVRNLLDVWIPVTFNVILSKMNLSNYLDHLRYLITTYPEVELYNIGFVQPHGMASKNIEDLFVSYNEIKDLYNKAIAYLKFQWKRVHSHLVWLPLCHLNEWWASMEYYNNLKVANLKEEEQTLIQSINDTNKAHDVWCARCMNKRVCSGIWKEYIWNQAVIPHTYKIFDNLAQPLEIKNIRKLYSQWIRQFWINTSHHEPDEVLVYIKEIRKYWFAWISLITKWTPRYNLEDVWWCNIQISGKFEEIYEVVKNVNIYNAWVLFQRRIHVDVIINWDTPWKDEEIYAIPRNENILIHISGWNMHKNIKWDYIYFWPR